MNRITTKKNLRSCVIVLVMAIVLAVVPCSKTDAVSVKAAKTRLTLRYRTPSTAKVRWKKIKGVSGYQIKYTISGKKTVKKNVSKSKKTYVIKIPKNKNAKVSLRGYKQKGKKKTYSKWSKKLTVPFYREQENDQAAVETKSPDVTPSPAPAKFAYNFRRPEYLTEHFQKHGAEFNYKTEEEYLAGANRVITSPEALHKKEKEDGDDVYYIESSNELVIVSTDGYIRTYFKPEDGLAYFNRQ